MGAGTEQRRERQREALIEAAEAVIASRGHAAIKARELAHEIGCAVGAIYNLVEDIDELVLRVGSRTLARLDAALSAAGTSPPDAVGRLVAIATAYCRFARANRNLWRTLFEHQMSNGKPVPDWMIEEQMRLFDHLRTPLRLILPAAGDGQIDLMSRTLFAAVHGVVLFGVDEKMIAVRSDDLEAAIEHFVRLICAGLFATTTRHPAEA